MRKGERERKGASFFHYYVLPSLILRPNKKVFFLRQERARKKFLFYFFNLITYRFNLRWRCYKGKSIQKETRRNRYKMVFD